MGQLRKVCQRCGDYLGDYPAISRRDNKTKICSECGAEEALWDYAPGWVSVAGKKREQEFVEYLKSKK